MLVGVWCSLSETGPEQAKYLQPVDHNGQFSKKKPKPYQKAPQLFQKKTLNVTKKSPKPNQQTPQNLTEGGFGKKMWWGWVGKFWWELGEGGWQFFPS